MLGPHTSIDDAPTLFCLHYLGGSAREWSLVAERLEATLVVVPLDLPGFGDSAHIHGYTVVEMVAFVADAIRQASPARWMIAGHSMGAKVAMALVRDIEDGVLDLPGLEGLVLLAGSPPSPEPMSDEQRNTMLAWFTGDRNARLSDARQYIANNSERLNADCTDTAVDDVLRANRDAWVAWLERGSREDWSERIGVLQTPALVISGADDENLGPDAQQRLTEPHFANVESVTIAGARHLLPMEAPRDVAALIREHARYTGYRALIASNRVSRVTRRALVTRARPDASNYAPAAMNVAAFQTLRAVLDRVIPQEAGRRIDLAARIDRDLHAAVGDGWRFALLPPDAAAYRAALLTLDEAAKAELGNDFIDLDGAVQDDLLSRIAAGRLGSGTGDVVGPGRLNAAQMRAWFEDVRADAVKAYMLHLETLSRIGYSGIANGGDGEPKSGFARIGVGERETWEPRAFADVRS